MLTLQITDLAVGGDGVGHDAAGRVVLVRGALPGETVAVEVVSEHSNHARAVAVDVIEAAAERVAPPCPFQVAGCGGCEWQHVDPAAQRRLKAEMVAASLRRLGGLPDPRVRLGPELPAWGYRTSLRGEASEDGRFSLHRHRSADTIPVDECLVAHPLAAAVIGTGRFPPKAEVVIRVGARTGARLVVVDPSAVGTEVPDEVRVVGGDELDGGKRAWFHEVVADRRFRISARSFFQPRPDGAEALVGIAAVAAGELLTSSRHHLVDLYGGVGLFAAVLGGLARITLVESSPSAVADARINLADLDAKVIRADVARWRPRPADVVVADPPRAGLGRRGVRTVVGTSARRVVLVSCDAGALGRDARLLGEAGYELIEATLVDQFVGTPHVEVVSVYSSSSPNRQGRG
jgi:23S rRNA (uracil1939-C5)-methyltransferase